MESDLINKCNISGLNSFYNSSAKRFDTDMPGLTSSSENESSDSDDSDTDLDRDIDDGTFLVTSVTNLRRRQMFGLETSFEDRKKALSENKRRKEIIHDKEKSS